MYQGNSLLMVDDDTLNCITAPARRSALEKGEIFVAYQPIIKRSVDNGWELDSVEALPRWQHPNRGLLLPTKFVPALEKSGLVAPLSDFVLADSVRQLVAWQQHSLNFSVAAHVPVALLDDSAFPDRLITALDSRNLDYARLVLEVSEDALMHNSARIAQNLTCLRNKGFGVSIHGFGTGYSSLTQLYDRLQFNELKIDASLVKKICASSVARTTIHAIIFLGQQLGVCVCADGVETQYAFSFLTEAGCDKLQGLLVGPAMAAVKLQSLAQARRNGDQIDARGGALRGMHSAWKF